MEKEEYVIVLDYLQHGYPLERKRMPVAQAIGEKHLTLLELVPRRGENLEVGERVYIGEGKRDKVYYILGKLGSERITESAKTQLQEHVNKFIKDNEQRFVEFFNKAEAINKRLHQVELLPGFGKKHTLEIIDKRKEKEFNDFKDIKKRISNLPDPEKAIEKRIIQELMGGERYNLFTS
jgi:putative nucleotide binding protein